MQSEAGAANCEKFVEVLGLKTFFPAFMGKVSPSAALFSLCGSPCIGKS